MIDDYGQKWKHTPAQFENNRKLVQAHNPTNDSMAAGPDIFDNYRRQVNDYGETSVYKCDCVQLVPNPAPAPKTDWCDGSAARSTKTRKQATQYQMTAVSAPLCPAGGRGGPRPPAAVPIVTVVIVP